MPIADLSTLINATAQNLSQFKGLSFAYNLLGGAPSIAGYTALIKANNDSNFGAGGTVSFNDENVYINTLNALYQGNATAKAAFDAIVNSGATLSDKLELVYNNLIPAAARTDAGLAYVKSQAAFYEARAIELGVSGANGAALVAFAGLAKIASDNDIGGLGDTVNDLVAAVNNGTAALPEDGTAFTPLETADGTQFDTDDIVVTPPSDTFTLTTGVDAIVGKNTDDTVNAVISATAGESTMTLADTVDGGGGTDTMNLLVSGNVSLPASGVKNVEIFNIKNLAGAVTAHDFSNVVGETQVWNSGSTVDVAVTGLDAAAIGVANTATDMTATFKASSFAAGSTANVALNNAGTSAADSTITLGQAGAAGAATSLAIAAEGSSFVTLAAGANAVAAANGIKTLTVTGSGTVDIDNTSDIDGGGVIGATLTKFDSSASTGGVKIQLANKDVAIIGGSGVETITLANAAALDGASIALGGGNDSLLNNGSAGVGTKASIDGGDGKDIIASTLLQVGNQANIKNFEILDLAGENRTIDASLFKSSTFESLALTAALGGATTVQNLAGAALNVNFTGGAVSYGTLTATLKDAAAGTADAGTFTFKDGISDIASLTTSGLETAAFVSGGKAATDTNTVTNFADTLNSLTTITVAGANAFTLTDVDVNTAETSGVAKTTAAALKTIDGSAATGALNITAGASDVLVNVTTTYDGLTIKGGSAGDTIVNAAKGGIVDGGAGNDTITVSGSGAVVNTGAAKDATGDIVNVNGASASVTVGDLVQTVVVQAGGAASATLDKFTTLTGAATGDKIDFTAILGNIDANVDTITNVNTNVAAAASLTEALELAAAVGGVEADGSIVFFNWADGNTYVVGEVVGAVDGLAAGDAVVSLVGTYTNFSAIDGVVTFG